jgi:hypothetical protein
LRSTITITVANTATPTQPPPAAAPIVTNAASADFLLTDSPTHVKLARADALQQSWLSQVHGQRDVDGDGDTVGVSEGGGVADAVPDTLDVTDAVIDTLGVTDDVTEIVGVTDDVTERVGVTEADSESVGVMEELSEIDDDSLIVTDTLALFDRVSGVDADAVAERLLLKDFELENDFVAVTEAVTEIVGVTDAVFDIVGETVGVSDDGSGVEDADGGKGDGEGEGTSAPKTIT